MQMTPHIYQDINTNFSVEVIPEYVPERSNPEMDYYFYAYTVTVRNLGSETCQLIDRHWIIRDGEKRVEHIRGEGVIGEKPVLVSGESFSYTSFCPLRTSTGSMRGSYGFLNSKGERFEVSIPLFFLRTPFLNQ